MKNRYDNVSAIEIIHAIKEQTGIRKFRDGMLAAHFICRPLSRPFSVWFIKHGVVPNQITLLMIIFGIIGSICFALPYVWSKIVGYMLWILWFTMDLSDGQVARYTKNFSKYGTEMDYMAHLIDHPCMNLAIWATFIEMNKWNSVLVSFIFILSISLELIHRNHTSMAYYQSKLDNVTIISNSNISLIKYFMTEVILYPTMIICFSWIIVVDYWTNCGFSFYLYCLWLTWMAFIIIRLIIRDVIRYYRE